MRVTNKMLSNNMMLGLNKNMNQLNKLYDQMNSLKKIQRPSDDPIILGRSLKLRLNVLETDQYRTNVGEARSWMEISEKAIDNTHEIVNSIRHELVQAANGPLGTEDRKKTLETVKQLKNQLIQESNANYAGRHVFGGYKTDTKVLFDKAVEFDDPDDYLTFKQKFTEEDIETVGYREEEYYRIRLPYGDINATKGQEMSLGSGLEATVIDSTDLPEPPVESYFHPGKGEAYFMRDTGELILSKEDAEAYMKEGQDFTISYSKSNFKEGDPNPEIFFDFEEGDPTDPDSFTGYTDLKSSQRIEYEVGIGTKMDINVLGKDIYDPLTLRDIDELIAILDGYDTVEAEINNEDSDKVNRSKDETINLSKLFSAGIGKMDESLKKVSGQLADLGSRMRRLELTEKRLGDDKISYTELLSRTEDVELEEAFIDFNTQYMVYQSALQVTAKVVQPTLMDFLR